MRKQQDLILVPNKLLITNSKNKTDMMDEFIKVLRNWRNFSGRAGRREFWMFALFVVILSLIVGLADGILDTHLFGGFLTVVVTVPYLAVAVRRMHDIDKSGWWILVNAVPVIGGLWFLCLAIRKGKQGMNRYGLDPQTQDYRTDAGNGSLS